MEAKITAEASTNSENICTFNIDLQDGPATDGMGIVSSLTFKNKI